MTSPINILLAFLGGLLGAALGGYAAFLLCVLALLFGTILSLLSSDPLFTGAIAWGPLIGPHVILSGAIAAAAYAARKGKLQSGKDLVTALWKLKDLRIILMGGFFGIGGYFLNTAFASLPPVSGIPAVNSIALSITVIALGIRIVLGKAPLTDLKNPAYPRWQPWAPTLPIYLIMTVIIAAISAVVARTFPQTLGMMFAVTSLGLFFLLFGIKIPLVYHVAWAAEFVAVMTGNIGWGIVFGFATGIVGELCASVFLVKGDTYIDPPAMALSIIFMIFPLLKGML